MRENRNDPIRAISSQRSGFENHSGPNLARPVVIEPAEGALNQKLGGGFRRNFRIIGDGHIRYAFHQLFDPRIAATTDELESFRATLGRNGALSVEKSLQRPQ